MGKDDIKYPKGLVGSGGAVYLFTKLKATTFEQNGIVYGFWACQRPLTHRWGSGQVFERLEVMFGRPDVAFGKTDGIPPDVVAIDHNTGYEWGNLSFPDNNFQLGYWDPPYDHLYKKEGQEIWRVCQKLAILHTYMWPRAWLKDAKREALIAITMGPMKQMRCLQIFAKGKVESDIELGGKG